MTSHETYLLNGIDLAENTLGTNIQSSSRPHPGISKRSVSLQSGQRDGGVAVRVSANAPLMQLTVRVPRESAGAFESLISADVLTLSHKGLVATVELLDAPGEYLDSDQIDYACIFRFNSMFWRDASPTDSAATAITTTPQTITVMPGLSAPVRDAVIRFKGGVTNPRVVDSAGTWMQYTGTVATTSWLRFELASGRAWINTSDSWTGGTEVAAALVATGMGPYAMELTPSFTDPLSRNVSLSVVSTARSGSPTVQVRGSRAHRI